MKKNMMIVVGALIVIFAGAFFVMQSTSRNTEDAMMTGEDSGNVSDDAIMSDDSAMDGADKMMHSKYVEFSPETLASAEGSRRVLFFYASWCPTCIPADKSFMEGEGQIPSDVVVIRVNYNDPETDEAEEDLARKYGVTYQHTFVQIDETGEVVTQWNGGQIDDLIANIK